MAGRALHELQEFKFEPCATTLAVHLVYLLYGDRAPLLFVDFYPPVGCGLWWRDVHVHSSTELPDARVSGRLFHDQIPRRFESFARDGGGTAPASFKAKHYAYSSTR
jgi:hypothetical protein